MDLFVPSVREPFNFAKAFAQTAQQAATPTFELQFFATQNAIQDSMQADIEAILSNSVSTSSQTAHLYRKVKALTPKLEAAGAYEARTKSNRDNIQATLDRLGELSGYAAPGTVAEFDAKLADTLEMLDKLKTAGYDAIGTPDGLRKAKTEAIADLGAIVHNNFATQADIDAAVATIDEITLELTASLTLVQINVDIAVNTADSLNESISRAQLEINDIEFAAREAQRDKVDERREYYGRILTSLSLAFEGALALTAAISQATILAEERQTGTMLDFVV